MRAISRRSVIAYSIAVSLSKIPFARSQGTTSLYLEESGTVGGLEDFVVGALAVRNSVALESELVRIRQEDQFNLELSYYSTNRHKLGFAKKSLNKTFRDWNAAISIVVVPESTRWPSKMSQRNALYFDYFDQSLSKVIGGSSIDRIVLKKRSLGARDQRLREHLRFSLGNQTPVDILPGKESNILQICDLVTGSVYGMLRRDQGVRSKVKTEANNLIVSALDIGSTQNLKRPNSNTQFKLDIL